MGNLNIKGLGMPILALGGILFAGYMVLTRPEYLPRSPVVPPPQSEFTKQVAGIGLVEPSSEMIGLNPDLSGLVRIVHAKVGDQVKAHAPLVTLDQREVDAEIASLKATLASAKIQAEDAELQYKLVRSVADPRAVAQDDVNRRKFSAELAQSKIAEIKAQLLQAETTKERLTITAPIDGTILSIHAKLGEFAASTGNADPMIRMGETTTLHVRVEFDEENVVNILPDSPAQGSLRGSPDQRIKLKFVRFEPYVRPKQNLQTGDLRVDTRVLQVIYALDTSSLDNRQAVFVGQQMDVFVDTSGTKEKQADNSALPEPPVTDISIVQ